jgi:hypothetical protein
MAMRIRSWRVWGPLLVLVLGISTLGLGQIGGKGADSAQVQEYTQQEVQANALIETLNELGKERWDVFQVIPVWKFEDKGGGAEMTPVRYQVLGRRHKADGK